ncbi:alpha-ketoglutarate-dependent dioxygenase AlkB [Streptomyces sp. NPDC048584]|uniref:alpha-ketoglutarate-dependent dioxygenase AlkB n=1 Tax=Streptomyces sp. NPDC048584 TaxID=3365573 RepID=UPI00371705E5
MHRDSHEQADAPMESLSLGDTCVCLPLRQHRLPRPPRTDVELRSGDLSVFREPSGLAHHGVPRVHAGTAPAESGPTGRLNITPRVSGP